MQIFKKSGVLCAQNCSTCKTDSSIRVPKKHQLETVSIHSKENNELYAEMPRANICHSEYLQINKPIKSKSPCG